MSNDTQTLSVKSLLARINDETLRLIDVRREEEYSAGHITNAVNLPLAKLLEDDKPENIAKLAGELGISDNTSVAIYDDMGSAWLIFTMPHIYVIHLLDVFLCQNHHHRNNSFTN